MYAALPHASLSADLSTLATQMVSSGNFKTAVVTPGGISATLPNGSPALIFADHIGDPSNKAATVPDAVQAARWRTSSTSSAPETIAILVNNTDDSGAFHPVNQSIFANEVIADGFNNSQYGVANGDVQLSTIAGAAGSGVIDYMDLATHGMVAVDAKGNNYYAWLSDTEISPAAISAYSTDFIAGDIVYAITLLGGGTTADYTFAFTPGFIAQHVHFAPGAIFVNQSCFGQNSLISSQTGSILQSAGVGRYYGWTEPVQGDLADQTDAFIWDRLLGENGTALGQFVTQRVPAQRPFPLDDVFGAVSTETRNGPFGTSAVVTYAQSPQAAGLPTATFLMSDFGGESVANPVIEYGTPTISNVVVNEDPSNPTLTINGHFPPQPGLVQIADSVTGYSAGIAPASWSTSQVVIPIQVSGPGSHGNVTVNSASGIPSNPVPLTQWTGQLTSTEGASWSDMSGSAGVGSGTVTVGYAIDFRADVHPTVPSIDSSPVPQNLAFTQLEGDSRATITSITGTFDTNDGEHTANFGTGTSVALVPGSPPFSNTFNVGAEPNEPATCNNSMPGPQPGPTTVFCPAIGFDAPAGGTCSDDAGTLCTSPEWDVHSALGVPTASSDGLLTFTMDPNTYAITVSSSDANVTTELFESTSLVSGGVTGTINLPASLPTSTTPALRPPRTTSARIQPGYAARPRRSSDL